MPIIAEDLGEITPDVIELREKFTLPGMKILQFGFSGPDNPFLPHNYPETCVTYTGTHDNDTTAGWFRGSPSDKRSAGEIKATQARVLELTGGKPSTIHADLIRFAFATRAVQHTWYIRIP